MSAMSQSESNMWEHAAKTIATVGPALPVSDDQDEVIPGQVQGIIMGVIATAMIYAFVSLDMPYDKDAVFKWAHEKVKEIDEIMGGIVERG